MSRFIQENNRPKKEIKEEKPRELKKSGQYTSEELMGSKKIYTGRGKV